MISVLLTVFACAVVPSGHFTTYPGIPTSVDAISEAPAVRLSPIGHITALRLLPDAAFIPITGESNVEGCSTSGEVELLVESENAMSFSRTVRQDATGKTFRIKERFSGGRDSVRWELEVIGDEPFTAPITTRLQLPVDAQSRFWTAWSDPTHSDQGWHDPLESQPVQEQTWFYGAPSFNEKAPQTGYCPVHGDTFCIPVATMLDPVHDLGLSLVLSPDDRMLDLELHTAKDGGIVFSRLNHRISKSHPVRFAMDLVVHPADPRAALGWMAARYPDCFEPPLPAAHDIAGCGAYSSWEGDLDAEKFRKMAFRVNWKASFDFPYMGMFMPPVPGEDDRWFRFNDKACGQPLPGEDNWSSVARMRTYSEKMRGYGFYVLNYLATMHLTKQVNPAPLPAPTSPKTTAPTSPALPSSSA